MLRRWVVTFTDPKTGVVVRRERAFTQLGADWKAGRRRLSIFDHVAIAKAA